MPGRPARPVAQDGRVARGPRIVIIQAPQLATGEGGRQLLATIVPADHVGVIGAEQFVIHAFGTFAEDAEHIGSLRQRLIVCDKETTLPAGK